MKTLWTIISVLALANVLALLGVLGWLKASGRLDMSRVERVRMLLAETVAAEQARESQARAADEQKAAAMEAERQASAPPVAAEQRIEDAHGLEEISRLRAERVQRETSDLIKTLLRERIELDRLKAEFKEEKEEFERMRLELAKQEGDEQFEKAVRLYQSVKPAQAKDMMKALIARGETPQVVSYLNALAPRTAAKIVAEFHAEDPSLAADLLERLRSRGIELPRAGT